MMTMVPEKIACPGCGEESVLRIRVKSTEAYIFVCGECEGVWLREKDIGCGGPMNLSNYMDVEGLIGGWDELEVLSGD